jgi:hypothetical protein
MRRVTPWLEAALADRRAPVSTDGPLHQDERPATTSASNALSGSLPAVDEAYDVEFHPSAVHGGASDVSRGRL